MRAASSGSSTGLREIVVGADLEADDAVDEVAGAGEDDDAGVEAARAGSRASSRPSWPGRPMSRTKRSGTSPAASSASSAGAVGGDHVVAREAEVIDEHLADFTVVIDHGDARHDSSRAAGTIETNRSGLGNRVKQAAP